MATSMVLNAEAAGRFADIALGHVQREYPNKLDHVMEGQADVRSPRQLHPIFYGSFDWHSCVHSYWMLARLLRRFPTMGPADRVRGLFDTQFVSDKVAGEIAYLGSSEALGFERPYGWGWLLKLSAELADLEDGRWSRTTAPLAEIFVERFRSFLPLATYPVRVGTHYNTAFALRLAADYASVTGDDGFASLLTDTAVRWYGDDQDCPAWGEPGGDDFQSSALVEAECMRRLLPKEDFMIWFDRFLPKVDQKLPTTLFSPSVVTDRSDGKIAHLDGLNLSRAWCFRALASSFPSSDRRFRVMEAAATDHLAAGLPHIAGDYMGEHWLATFAVLALDEP
jgi:hypothetical protein